MTPVHALKALVVLCIASFSMSAQADYDLRLDEEELDFLDRINAYRESIGAPCLTPSPTMNAAADYLSRFMGEEGFFDHNEPPCDETGDICTGRDPFDRIDAFGHTQWMTSAENIAAGNSDGASTFEQWKNSPGHDRNMRNPDFTSIGIGRVEVPGSYYTFYWTTNFSDFIDGNGDCTRDDPSDYGDTSPVDGSGDTVGDSANDGGCTGIQGASFWALLGIMAWARRRPESRGV